MKPATRAFRFRRRLRRLLATGKPISAKGCWLVAALIFSLSFATKSLQAVDLAPVMRTAEQPMSGLTFNYDLRAAGILKGEGLLGPYDVDRSQTRWLAQAPGYSIFLSAVYRMFGRDFFKVQLVQNVLNSISPVLVFLVAGLVVSWRVGIAAGLLAAVSHHLSHMSNFILPDSISALPVLAGMLLLARARRGRAAPYRLAPYWLYLAAGVMFGLTAWLRSQTMFLSLFLILMLALISVERLGAAKRAALIAATAALVIAPITIRNWIVYDAFVPINIGLGIVLWEGIADASGDRFGAVQRDEEVAEQEAALYDNPQYAWSWSYPDGIERDRDRVKKSLAIISQHPFWYAGVMVGRCGDMMKYSAHAPLVYRVAEARAGERTAAIRRGWETATDDDAGFAIGKGLFWTRPIIRGVQRITKETLLPFILIGAAALFAGSWRRGLFISVVPLYYFLFQSFTHTEFRYTLPMQHFIFIFAAIAWVLIGAAGWQAVKSLINRYGSKRYVGR